MNIKLKEYGKLLLEERSKGELFCVVVACVEDGKLQLHREDYGEWELNRRNGKVECDYYIDELNTEKLCHLLQARTSAQLIKSIARQCHSRSGISYTGNFRNLCEENDVEYDYQVWY